MPTKEIVDFFFYKENETIDLKYYDPQDVNIDPEEGILDLRVKFNITKPNPFGGQPLRDKICDGAGHYNSCPYYLIEVTATDILHALIQLKSTIRHIYETGDKVKKIALILDINRWNDRLGRINYKIQKHENLLYKRRKIINEKVSIIHNGTMIYFDVYCYLIDFKKFSLK